MQYGYLSGAKCRLADATATHCFLLSKIQIGFTFLVPAYPGSPAQRAIKGVCVCVSRYTGGYTAHRFQVLATHTHKHTHPFNGPFSRTTQVSRYQKGKTNLDVTEARDSEWQWHQLEQTYASLHHAPDRQPSQHPTTQFFYRPDALPAAQPTASKH